MCLIFESVDIFLRVTIQLKGIEKNLEVALFTIQIFIQEARTCINKSIFFMCLICAYDA